MFQLNESDPTVVMLWYFKTSGIQYRKNPKNSDTWKICSNHPKFWIRWLYRRVMRQKDTDRIVKSVDRAVWGAVRSGSALFALTFLSKNLGSLQYVPSCITVCAFQQYFSHIKSTKGTMKGSVQWHSVPTVPSQKIPFEANSTATRITI